MSTPVHPVRVSTPDCTCLQLALHLSAIAEQRPLASFHLSFRTEQGYGHGTYIHGIFYLKLYENLSTTFLLGLHLNK
jgi:hypothetical protein